MNNPNKQVVFITGASSGIGAALANEYAQHGSSLVLAARRIDKLSAIAEKCRALGSEVLVIACDVTQQENLQKALEQSLEKFGRVDTVIANAGFGVAGPFSSLELEDYHRQFKTNIDGVILSAKVFAKELIQNKGRLAIVGSVNSYIALPEGSPYAMSKFAVRAFAESLAFEWKRLGVSVTLICPGFIESEIRLVNNKGVFRDQAKDPIPVWIQMPAAKAAKEIFKAIQSRKAQAIITFHAKVLIGIARHFPQFFRFLISKFGVKGRSEPQFKNPT